MLTDPVTAIKGVGPKRALLFQKLGIQDVRGLLYHFPRDYEDLSRVMPAGALTDGAMACVRVRLAGSPKVFRSRGMTVVSVSGADETGTVRLTWFNQPYRLSALHPGEVILAAGRASLKKGRVLVNPSLVREPPGILPVYPTVSGLSQRQIREAVRAALEQEWDSILEILPEWVIRERKLCDGKLALRHIHFPADSEALRLAEKRITYETMLSYLTCVELQRSEREHLAGIRFEKRGGMEQMIRELPFPLTDAQKKVVEEVARDMERRAPMNRLIQGDVGSGKTVVAMAAIRKAMDCGYQAALMAPTEILARQHFLQAEQLFGDRAVLLTGSLKKSEREQALRKIASGEAACVIGTHALIQESVRFSRLGLAVTDEQHRFGVQQRMSMQDKGVRPDVLVMSATPIPRTLALLLYGDLDLSVIDAMPPGRLPVRTRRIPEEKRKDMYAYLIREAKADNRAYVVCPFIEDSEAIDAPSVESVLKEIREMDPEVGAAMLHGHLPEKEKQKIMERFRSGEVRILVSTTVIEVGVHVPEANLMVIEGADRFGLSQLHQLRGRVGRGNRQAYCFLLTRNPDESVAERLELLCSTSDGFEIAEKDLELRGAGDLFGFRQSGLGDSGLLGLTDGKTMKQASEDAKRIADVPTEENRLFAQLALERTAGRPVAMN